MYIQWKTSKVLKIKTTEKENQIHSYLVILRLALVRTWRSTQFTEPRNQTYFWPNSRRRLKVTYQ